MVTGTEAFWKRVTVYLKLFLGFVLIGSVLIFTVENAYPVTVRWFAWQLELSQSLLVFFVFFIGALSGALTMSWFHWRTSRQRRER